MIFNQHEPESPESSLKGSGGMKECLRKRHLYYFFSLPQWVHYFLQPQGVLLTSSLVLDMFLTGSLILTNNIICLCTLTFVANFFLLTDDAGV